MIGVTCGLHSHAEISERGLIHVRIAGFYGLRSDA